MNQVTAVDLPALTYDGRGNLTSDAKASWSYDWLVASGAAAFEYVTFGRL